MLVWSTGLAPNPLIDSITELQHDEKTHSYVTSFPSSAGRCSAKRLLTSPNVRLKVNGHFQAQYKDGKIAEDIFVIGDCAMLEEKLPATAQGELLVLALAILLSLFPRSQS